LLGKRTIALTAGVAAGTKFAGIADAFNAIQKLDPIGFILGKSCTLLKLSNVAIGKLIATKAPGVYYLLKSYKTLAGLYTGLAIQITKEAIGDATFYVFKVVEKTEAQINNLIDKAAEVFTDINAAAFKYLDNWQLQPAFVFANGNQFRLRGLYNMAGVDRQSIKNLTLLTDDTRQYIRDKENRYLAELEIETTPGNKEVIQTVVEGDMPNLNGIGMALDDIVLAMKADFLSTWNFNKISNDLYEVIDGAGTKWGTITRDKITAPGRTTIGTTGNPILNKATLVKNIKYDVDGFIYQTDDLGRVVKTNADLDDIARVRLGNQQIRAVDIKDGVRGVDQGGHIVGSRFYGPGEQINLYPQSANLNQGAWKTMENSWADAMVQGKDVKIEVEAIFSGTSKRPDAFDVSYWIDGVKTKTSFINQ
jgi:DNA/RNA non-specific endonuclease